MKKLILNFVILICITSVYGQHRKSITDTVFSLEQANVYGTLKHKVNLLNLDVPLKILPVTVTRLSSEVLERKNILNLEDAVRFLPGVTVKDQLGAFYRFSVRGSSEAVVSIDGFRDERSLLNNVPFGDLSSVESIEVLKGAAAVLSGHSVMGGVINIVRKKAVPDFMAGARLSYGNWGVKSASLDFGGKLVGPLTYRATAHYSTGDGYRHVHADRFSVTGTLAADFGKTGHIEGTIGYSDDKYDTEIGSAPVLSSRMGDVMNAEGKIVMPVGARNPFADYHTIYNDFNNNMMKRRVTDVSLTYTQELTSFMKLRDRFSWNHSDLDYASVEGMNYRTDTLDLFNGGYYYERGGKKYYIDLTDSLITGSPLCFSPDSRGWTNMLELTGEFKTGSVGHKYIIGYTYSFFNYTQYNGWNSGDT
ncbi:TonB-dependent siderophore receptor [uncultured Odoribacter sp.]|uniref:TonB-dependent siderophore receptor n=1 Tax=uncultured Odoribacter sp. TaxID=876416 RepID=UPI0026247F4C|nr:TonB-dependent receptor plug domain-containing protein [uncultured Odoribacter sp.]